MLGCTGDDEAPPEVTGVYRTTSLLRSAACDSRALEPASDHPYFAVERARESFVLYPCTELLPDDCLTDVEAHLVGDLVTPTADGYFIDRYGAAAGSGTCWAGYVRASVERPTGSDIVRVDYLEMRAGWPVAAFACDAASARAHAAEMVCVTLEHVEGEYLFPAHSSGGYWPYW